MTDMMPGRELIDVLTDRVMDPVLVATDELRREVRRWANQGHDSAERHRRMMIAVDVTAAIYNLRKAVKDAHKALTEE